jgi:hypothetical protein
MARRVVENLKKKWGISSNLDFVLIMLSFSLAGSMISVCRKPLFALLGVKITTPFWIKTLIYVPLIPPLYQVLLMIFGTLLGQFNFFWEKEKRLGRLLLRARQGTKAAPPQP